MRLWTRVILVAFAAAGPSACRDKPPAPARMMTAPTAPDRDYFEVWLNGKRGFMDRAGKIVIKPTFDEAYNFTEGLAAVQQNGLWGYIDGAGAWVIPPTFPVATPFSEGRASVRVEVGGLKAGYIDRTGVIVVPAQYDCADVFRNGAAKVGTRKALSKLRTRFADVGMDCDTHYIDANGSTVAAPPHLPEPASHRLTPFKVEGLMGYRDADGRVVIEARFAYAAPFERGLALVTVRKGDAILAGYIDEQWRLVWQPSE